MVNYKGYLIGGNNVGYFIKCKKYTGDCIPFVSYEDCKDIVNEFINKQSNEGCWVRQHL